ncbi:hypothetical protein BU24DRAFT_139468 [Aaosphaeria arxii CBS 175.79]|uniref:Uncharacterized protein n=1 Tax=Aaosphaeria arxii CBS 175.79 TaxID=1450172 RepID=A0A6A5XVV8_9PLEO|nr:uncharacterized protein BU24DRAFT_139468 [Aaosphaeria arxii CBS 175.79]KAF2016841.1 hypothetical protein BU24DRAFT_139468 [Aaosphaeria arxii CBS 175.79]
MVRHSDSSHTHARSTIIIIIQRILALSGDGRLVGCTRKKINWEDWRQLAIMSLPRCAARLLENEAPHSRTDDQKDGNERFTTMHGIADCVFLDSGRSSDTACKFLASFLVIGKYRSRFEFRLPSIARRISRYLDSDTIANHMESRDWRFGTAEKPRQIASSGFVELACTVRNRQERDSLNIFSFSLW